MKEFGQIDTMALYKRLRHREPNNYRLDRVLMSGINEVEGVNMEQALREEEHMQRENSPKTISPRTRELIDENSRWRLDGSRRVPTDLNSPRAKEIIESSLCPEVAQPRGTPVAPPVEAVYDTIKALVRMAQEMADVAHSEEGYTDFDGFAYAAIYVDRVIKEQFGGVLPCAEHMHVLSKLHLDPLHKHMADRDYLIEPGRLNTTGRVMTWIRDYIYFVCERPWPEDHLEKLAMMKEVDKQLHYIVVPWLRHRRHPDQRIVHVPRPKGLYHDGWLYQQLKDAQREPRDRDFFNMWTTEDPNRLIPRDVLERAVDPSLPPFKKDDV